VTRRVGPGSCVSPVEKKMLKAPIRGLGLAALLLMLPGCGGGGSASNLPTMPTPRTPVRTVLFETTFSDLDPAATSGLSLFVSFPTSVAGDLDITVDWTFATNDMDLYLYRGANCTPRKLNPTDCLFVAQAITLRKPEVLTLANAVAGSYVLEISNRGTTLEAGVVIAGLTTH
jgi:hypothetical protein